MSGKTATLTKDQPSHKFEKLPKYQADGETEIEYGVEEGEVKGYASEVGDLADGKVTITNTQETTEIEVDKKWANADGSEDWPEGVTVDIQLTAGGEAVTGKTATLSADQPSYKFESLPKYQADGETEIEYGVKEVKVTGYAVEVGDLADGKVTITNTQETGGLKVTKSVVSSTASDKNKEFTFTVTLDNTSITGTYGDMEFTDGVATFTLKDGESKEAEGLPTTAGFKVEESDNDGFVVTSTGTTGTVTKDVILEAVFTNTRVEGGLAVTKSVTSDLEADHSQKFSFKVTLDDKAVNGKYGDMTFTDGVAEFQLADGESCIAEGLAEGIGYTVEEEAASSRRPLPARPAPLMRKNPARRRSSISGRPAVWRSARKSYPTGLLTRARPSHSLSNWMTRPSAASTAI